MYMDPFRACNCIGTAGIAGLVAISLSEDPVRGGRGTEEFGRSEPDEQWSRAPCEDFDNRRFRFHSN